MQQRLPGARGLVRGDEQLAPKTGSQRPGHNQKVTSRQSKIKGNKLLLQPGLRWEITWKINTSLIPTVT